MYVYFRNVGIHCVQLRSKQQETSAVHRLQICINARGKTHLTRDAREQIDVKGVGRDVAMLLHDHVQRVQRVRQRAIAAAASCVRFAQRPVRESERAAARAATDLPSPVRMMSHSRTSPPFCTKSRANSTSNNYMMGFFKNKIFFSKKGKVIFKVKINRLDLSI